MVHLCGRGGDKKLLNHKDHEDHEEHKEDKRTKKPLFLFRPFFVPFVLLCDLCGCLFSGGE